jgi:hypothetical protein
MDRVSDEWLDEQISLYDHLGDEISDLGKERCAALVELRDRRAADDPEDAEYASYEASKAQAEQLAAMTAGQLERLGSGVMFELMRRAAEREQAATEANTKPLGWVDRLLEDWEKGYENAVDGSVSKTTAAWYINRLREAYSEQAAPEPRKPTKWERRLDRMSGGLHFNYSGGEGWYASWMIDGGVVKYAYGDTPKAAVEAAWKAWKEERGE